MRKTSKNDASTTAAKSMIDAVTEAVIQMCYLEYLV